MHNQLQIGKPDGWRDSSTLLLLGPPNDGYSPSLMVTRDPEPGASDAAGYAQAQLETLQKQLAEQGYTVEEEGKAEVAGRPAYRRIHRFNEPMQQIAVTQIQVHLIVNDQVITLTATDRSEQFPQTRATLLAAIEAFALSEQPR